MAKKKKSTFPLSLSSVCFLVFLFVAATAYFHNLTQDIYGGDVGDLTTASLVGGVAHPPGYPLFVFLGFVFSHLPLPFLPVTKVALVSFFASIGSLIVFKKIISLIIRNTFFQILSTSIFSFTYLFWLYTELPEVFALNVFMSLVVIYLSLSFYNKKEFKFLLLIFLFYGIGATNHQTIFLTAPFFLAVLISSRKEVLKFRLKLLLVLPLFIIGLLPYIYVPIASSFHPVVNWDSVDSIQSFLQLVLRRDYGTFSAGPFPAAISETKLITQKAYFDSLIQSLTIPVLFISLFGIIRGVKKQKVVTLGLFSTILLSGPFFIVYAGFPLVGIFVLGAAERFYLLSQVLLMLFLPLGFEAIYLFFKRFFSKEIYSHLLVGVFVLIPLFLFILNFPKTDLSSTRLGTNIAKDYLKNLPKGSYLFLSGDTRSFNTWYVHHALNFRPDVNIVQIGNFGINNPQFEKIYKRIQTKIDVSGADLFMNTVLEISKNHPVFAMAPFKIPEKEYAWFQNGFPLQLIKINSYPTGDEYKAMLSKNLQGLSIPYADHLSPSERSLILLSIPPYYSSTMTSIGDEFLDRYDNEKMAREYFQQAINIDPTDAAAYYGMTKIYIKNAQCSDAQNSITKAITLFPVAPEYYVSWYEIAANCLKDKDKAQRIVSLYENKFKGKMTDAVKKYNEKDNK